MYFKYNIAYKALYNLGSLLVSCINVLFFPIFHWTSCSAVLLFLIFHWTSCFSVLLFLIFYWTSIFTFLYRVTFSAYQRKRFHPTYPLCIVSCNLSFIIKRPNLFLNPLTVICFIYFLLTFVNVFGMWYNFPPLLLLSNVFLFL